MTKTENKIWMDKIARQPLYKYTPKPGVPKAIRSAASLMGKRNKGVLKHISEDERLARGERARHCTAVRMARMKGGDCA
jgi:hypothetical protein